MKLALLLFALVVSVVSVTATVSTLNAATAKFQNAINTR